MGCHNIDSLDCVSCNISSCCHPYMRTPVSKEDVIKKNINVDYLRYNKSKGMYFIERYTDGSCLFFDSLFKSCKLEPHQRPTSCLVFPVRLKWVGIEIDLRVILNLNCPSAFSMVKALMKDDKLTKRYVKTAVLLFDEDPYYVNYMLSNTASFNYWLDIGSYQAWKREVV